MLHSMPPTACLETIELQKLQTACADEAFKLFRACTEDGFFYLDMRGPVRGVQEAVDDIYSLQRELFAMEQPEKMRYDIDVLSPRRLNGYKPIGRNRGEIAGRRDGFESYALPKDGILGLTQEPFPRPAPVDTHLPALRTFCLAMSQATATILQHLSSSLMLSSTGRLEDMHRTHLPSPDLIRLLKYCPLPASEQGSSHVPHTDLGSLTFLFTQQPGLQVKRAQSSVWEAVEPRTGFAVVNLGDSLSMLTGGYLKSCVHRVAPLPGQAREERFSFAYFCRAEDNVLMRPLSSPYIQASQVKALESQKAMTSKEWIQRKYEVLRANTWKEEIDWMLVAANPAVI